jgi:hypothetical protein
MKFVLVLYMCSTITNLCPNSSISGYQFDNHYECVNAGYAIAQNTFTNLNMLEEWDKDYINKNKIVIKFECKELSPNA